mgnify:CR=1 FL=1
MSDGDLSALLTFLAIPAGGLIAAGILWAMLRPPKGVTMNTDPTLKPDIAALQKRLAEDPGFAAEVTGDRPRAKLNDEAPSNAAHWHKVAMECRAEIDRLHVENARLAKEAKRLQGLLDAVHQIAGELARPSGI